MHIAGSPQTPALGAAISAAVSAGAAAGGYDRFEDAQRGMTSLQPRAFRPDRARQSIYDDLYGMYRELHDSFGGVGGGNVRLGTLMKRLLALRDRVAAAPQAADRQLAGA
jgi:L-ribulokinase